MCYAKRQSPTPSVHSRRRAVRSDARQCVTLGLVLCALCLILAACLPPDPVSDRPAPTAAPLAATEFLATRVQQVLTENAATLTSAPTATASVTPIPSQTPTRTPVPTGTPTPTASPYPTLVLANFPTPPAAFAGEPHFFFGRPIGEGGNMFIASSYRYGSTGSHRFETHHGVEFPNAAGVPLVAVAPGIIYYAGSDQAQAFGPQKDFYGNLVVLEIAQPWQDHKVYALYGHMDQVLVQTGQPVNAGGVLGTVGATGVALGAHLHLETRLDKPESYWDTRNPELWLKPRDKTGTVAVRVTNERGQYLPGMRVSFTCSDGAYRFLDTYWDFGVNPDDAYGENAAMTDVPEGFCQFETTFAGKKLTQTARVTAGEVTFVWLRP